MMSMKAQNCLISYEASDLERGEYKSEMCWIQSDLHVCGKCMQGLLDYDPAERNVLTLCPTYWCLEITQKNQ